ncbi:hypothetical protein FOG51_02827 [Hanseniaspora uvarum]|nr:hypothetical protein FOG48_00090 [Hanseniaspora uvarum]KAF0272197.1 hypothetical protein FOG51_02827 [Hanseniaspora uvarum]GMM43064.1 Rrp15 protein [Hanseniaspora uvarum]
MVSNKKITISQKKRKLSDIKEEAPKLNNNTTSSDSNESSSEEEAGSSESDFDLNDIENTNIVKKQKMAKNDDGSEQFSSAMSAILGSHLKQYDRIDPIMARQKKALEKIEQDKLDEKARKLLSREKKKFLTKSRRSEIIPENITEDNSVQKLLEQEKKLKKIAQKGVVRLFNVITTTQLKTERQVSEKLASSNIKSIIHKEKEQSKLISEVSKETFLDLVKAAGDDEEEDLF